MLLARIPLLCKNLPCCPFCTVLLSGLPLSCAAKICELYPIVEEKQIIDAVLPKKEQAALAKL